MRWGMRIALLAIYSGIVLFGCGNKDNPAASRNALDTSARTSSGPFKIQRFDATAQEWKYTQDIVQVISTWRFVSAQEGNSIVEISGGYSAKWTNTQSEDIEGRIIKLIFYDANEIPLAEYMLPVADNFKIPARGDVTRNGTFTISLSGGLPVAKEVLRMGMFGALNYVYSAP